MKNNRGMIAGTLLTLTTVLGVGAGAALQEQGTGQRAGSKLDEAGRSIKQGLRDAGDAIRNQFAKARDAVHGMGVESRVYGRLHWDKALNTSVIELEFSNGVVTLRGSVPSLKAKIKAVDLAQDTVGVVKVIDQLAVQPPPRETSERAPATAPRP
jgi:hyperosmotically inducible periplasmic protein